MEMAGSAPNRPLPSLNHLLGQLQTSYHYLSIKTFIPYCLAFKIPTPNHNLAKATNIAVHSQQSGLWIIPSLTGVLTSLLTTNSPSFLLQNPTSQSLPRFHLLHEAFFDHWKPQQSYFFSTFQRSSIILLTECLSSTVYHLAVVWCE